MRSPFGRAVGLGSAKEGVQHWWAQRLTAVALVVLGLWFVASLVGLLGSPYDEVLDWLASPVPALLTVLALIAGFYHATLGVQVVIEDYVHGEGVKLASLILLRLVAFLFAAAGIFAVLRIAFGS
jgi:succinate dehydrogenase / fumarate reductase membrane anchor subunit